MCCICARLSEIPVQLMKPLLLQLVRWYSRSNAQRMTPSDTEIAEVLLESIADGLGDDTHARMREFSAVALSEFFTWSVKQSAGPRKKKSAPGASPRAQMSSTNLLRLLFGLCRHPQKHKRIGAALVRYAC